MLIIDFKETQRFKSWWVWVILIVLNGFFAYIIIQQVIFGKPFGNAPMSNTNLLLASFIPLSLLFFVFSIRLDTSISAAGIRYRYYPFQLKETIIQWEDLSEAYMRQYNSFYEYGGWGIRIGNAKTNRAINTSTSGNIGLQLEFKNGSSLLIGTRRPDEIKDILNQLSAQGKIGWKV